jgi:hypothetical protein
VAQPRDVAYAVDNAFFLAAINAAKASASTHELTAFKFNAAWRRDSYKLKSTYEQEAMLRRIESATEFRHEELLCALQGFASGKFGWVLTPNVAGEAPGSRAKINSRFKGAEPRFAPGDLRRIEGVERFLLTDIDPSFEWYSLEHTESSMSFRWSGPAKRSALDLPVHFDRELAIRVHVVNYLDQDALSNLKVEVDGMLVDVRIENTKHGSHLLHLVARPKWDVPPKDGLRITFAPDRLLRPIDLGMGEDRRWLGIAVNYIEVAPLVRADVDKA